MGDVEQQLRECKKQIDALPRAISTEPCSFVNTILMDFCDDIKAHMRGSPLFAELVQSNKKTYAVFKDQIRQTAPPFVPFHPENLLSQECADFSKQYLPPAGPHRGQMMYLRDVKDRILQCVIFSLFAGSVAHPYPILVFSGTSPASCPTTFRTPQKCLLSGTSRRRGSSRLWHASMQCSGPPTPFSSRRLNSSSGNTGT